MQRLKALILAVGAVSMAALCFIFTPLMLFFLGIGIVYLVIREDQLYEQEQKAQREKNQKEQSNGQDERGVDGRSDL